MKNNCVFLQSYSQQTMARLARRHSGTGINHVILRGDTTLLWRFDGGYVSLNANGTPTCWNYYITDHLGSTRMVVDSNDSIKETVNYYPFGSEMRMAAPAHLTNNLGHPFRFTGKELDRQNGLNMYDFGARWYDVAGVPMWTSMDPLCEKYYNISPYAYCGGNPVNAIDPDGMDWLQARGDSVFWYGGELNDMSELKYSFASTSGYAEYDKNGDVLESYQKAKYQFLENTGPTPEGVYEINLEPSPTRHAKIIDNQYIPNNLGGIEMTDYEENGIRHSSSAWGRFRARLTPISVNKNIKRNIKSFYLHDSTKGYTHGCIEVESLLFDLLINYRENNSSIKVKVQYPSSNHITNGGTKR